MAVVMPWPTSARGRRTTTRLAVVISTTSRCWVGAAARVRTSEKSTNSATWVGAVAPALVASAASALSGPTIESATRTATLSVGVAAR